MPSIETDEAFTESFGNGVGVISNAWNVDTSTPGQIVLPGGSAAMQPATGRDAGQGYGTYTIDAKFDGTDPGAGIIFWPGDDRWPGQEIDMGELAADGSGQQYGIVHWNEGGNDAYQYDIFEGVGTGVFHDYTMVWEPDAITFLVDGAEVGRITDHVPADYDDGGMNNTIGFINNNPASTLTVRQVDYTPLGTGGDTGNNGGGGGGTTGGSGGEWGGSPPPPSGSEPDWDAIAAVVTAIQGATGAWPDLPASTDDWNAFAAEATAEFQATGDWLLG